MAVLGNDLEHLRHHGICRNLANPHLSVAHVEVPLGVQVPWLMQNLMPMIQELTLCVHAHVR